jgi:RHS repeat-associated protein
MQTDTSQNSVASRTYDAFGNVLSSTGTWNGPFGYGGGFGYQEDRSGLMLLGHRYYDSSTGSFLTSDPIKHDRNWYVYGNGSHNPVNGVDPEGLAALHVNGTPWHLYPQQAAIKPDGVHSGAYSTPCGPSEPLPDGGDFGGFVRDTTGTAMAGHMMNFFASGSGTVLGVGMTVWQGIKAGNEGGVHVTGWEGRTQDAYEVAMDPHNPQPSGGYTHLNCGSVSAYRSAHGDAAGLATAFDRLNH